MTEPLEHLFALVQAAETHDFEGIVHLLGQGAHPDSPLDDGTLLTWSVRQGQQGLVWSLIDYRADVDLADASGNTPLIHAAKSGMQDIVEILIAAGADPFRRNGEGKSAYEATQAALRDLYNELDNPNVDPADIESHCGRLGRITLMLEEAEGARTQKNEIDSCHAGARQDFIVGRPLKLTKGNAP